MAIGLLCGSHAVASSRVQGWGRNFSGQVGDGTIEDRNVPTDVAAGLPSNVSAISVGYQHVLAVADGAVYAWGGNSDGQLGTGPGGSILVPTAVPGLASGVTSVSAGGVHSLAIRNGAAYSWGYAGYGALGTGPKDFSDHTYTPTAIPTLPSDVTTVAAGFYFSLTAANGAAYGYGWNADGQVGNGSDWDDPFVPTVVLGMDKGVTAVAVGDQHSFAIKDGALYAWGDNNRGKTGIGEDNGETYIPQPVSGMGSGVTAIAGGGSHSLFLKDGVVYATGDNSVGQLGRGFGAGNESAFAQPISTFRPGTFTAIAANTASSYALNAEGQVYTWGSNLYGQLGIGSFGSAAYSPTGFVPPAGHVYTAISASNGGTAAAILSRPDAAVGATAIGPVLSAGSLTPATPAIAGAFAIDPQVAAAGTPLTIQLDLADPTQAAALINNLNILYGDGTASATVGGLYDVQLLLASTDGVPSYFNFDFTYVVAAGAFDQLGISSDFAYASVPIVGLSIAAVPEPASLGVLAVAATGLLARRRRREG